MRKKRVLKVFMLVLSISLLGSAVAVQASSSKTHVNTKDNIGAQGLAEDLVNALFTDSTHTKLVPGVTQTTIDIARSAVNLLFPSSLKTFLLELLSTADRLLLEGQLEAAKVAAATAAVSELFVDAGHGSIKIGTTIEDINAAQALVDDLADPLVRAPLNALIVIARNLFTIMQLEIQARSIVDALFTDSNHIGLKIDITQGDIDNAKSLVDALSNVGLKVELNLLITSAQLMLNMRNDEETARIKVYGLFSDSSHTVIRQDLTQAEINEAKALVDALSAGDTKTQLTILIKLAQSQLDGQTGEETAIAIVDDLFTDGTHTAIIDGLSQSAIDDALNVVNALPDGQVKTDLIALINTAQDLLDARNEQATIVSDAQAAVDGLFTDSAHTTIKTDLVQADIDAAKVKVNLITDADIKARLNNLIDTAQDLLNARNDQTAINDAAKTAVYDLFTDDTHTIIKDTTDQAGIDDAQAKVNLMQDGILKSQLNLLIASAQAQLDLKTPESIAAAVVEALFSNDSHTALVDGITQTMIDNALDLVMALPDSAIKDNLLTLVHTAQNLFDQASETPQEREARTAVNDLFADLNNTMLKDTTDQIAINMAKAKVDALTSGSVKTELMVLVTKAQTLLDERAATETVDNLFTDNTHTALAAGTTQAMIGAATEQVNALKPGQVKTDLLQLLQTAQMLMNERNAADAVDSLFTDDTHSALAPGITQAIIDNVKILVDALAPSQVKTDLLALLATAQDLLDLDERTATSAVNNLFTDDTHTALASGVIQSTIDNAKILVNALKPSQVKTDLLALIQTAQGLLDVGNSSNAVDNLFTDDTHTVLAPGVSQTTIDHAKALVDALPDGQTKTDLLALIQTAQGLLQQGDASKAVDNLFTDDTHTVLAAGVTQTTINNAKAIVDALPEGQAKTDLLALIAIAQNLFNSDEAIATTAVNNLFTDDTHTALAPGVTQVVIDNAKTLVLALPAGQVKTNLLALIQTAQVFFNEGSATTAVNNLFTDDTHTALAPGVTQVVINNAKTLVLALPAGQTKTNLLALIVTAQDFLNEAMAITAVNNLFTDDTHTALAPGVNQATIAAAKTLVDALNAGQVKTNLLVLIQVAIDLLPETPQEQEARAAVDSLFTDANHTALKDTTDQIALNIAKAKVDALSDGNVKIELTILIVKAQDLLDERTATNAVNALFTDDTHTALKPGVIRTTVDAANDLVIALKNGSVKTYLLQQITVAYNLLTETPEEQEARAAVDDLFTDGTHSTLKDTTTQALINAAKVKVNNLDPSSTKTELTNLLVRAQDLFNERNARNAVNALFTDDSHTAIKTDTNQAKINAATALVNALKDSPVKVELYGHLSEAQELLDQRMEAEAIEAVDNLYTDINHTAIKDTTTQAMINAAGAKVNALRPSQTKTDLGVLIITAQYLLDERNATILVEGFFVDETHQALKPDVFRPMIRAARERVLALRLGQVRTYLLELLDIADRYLDDHQPQEGDEYTYWNGTGTYWYRYMGRERWWNFKITTPQYTTQTYYASFRCVSEMPEPMNCATLNTRYDFTKDATGRIIAQKYQKWDVKGLIYSYRLFTYNPTLNLLVKTYDKETRYYSNTRIRQIDVQNKNLNTDQVTMKDKLEYRSNGVQQRYFYHPHNGANGLPQRLDKVVYNSSGEKRTRGSSRAYFYQQSYNASGRRTTTYRWTYDTSGRKTNRITYKEISY